MNQHLSDEELIRRYLHTHQNDYFGTLYSRYVSKVHRRCLSLTNDAVWSEDFTQEIFVRIHSNLTNFRERSAFSTWLYSIVYNYCMDQLRQAGRRTTVALEDGQDVEDGDTGEYDGIDTQLQYLDTAMEAISPDEVRMLRLKYQDGLDLREVASQFRLNDSAMKMRLKRSRDKVRRLYRAQLT